MPLTYLERCMKKPVKDEIDLLRETLGSIQRQPFPAHILTSVISLNEAEMFVALAKIRAAFGICGWQRFNFNAELSRIYKERFNKGPEFKFPRLTKEEQQLFFWKTQFEEKRLFLHLILFGKFSDQSRAFQDRWGAVWADFDADDYLILQCFEFDGVELTEFDMATLYYSILQDRQP